MDPITLQQILDAVAAADGDVAALLTGEAGQATDLAVLEQEAVTAFDDLRAQDALSDEDVAALETLTDAVEAIRTEQSRRDEVAAEQRARVDELAQRVTPPADDADNTDTDDADAEATDADGTGDAEGDTAVEAAENAEPEEARPEPVAASGRRRVDLARIARRRQPPAPPAQQEEPRGGRLVAAADVPGVSVGSEFAGWDQVTEAAIQRFGSLPARGSQAQVRNGVLVVRKDAPEELVASSRDDTAVIEHAATEHRLPGSSLVAAGGWCAPSETIYELCELEAADGLIDLPEIVATRGGIRWSPGPDFASIYSNTGFIQTETQAIAAEQKPCYEVPCPSFSEARLDAIGVCISAGILQNRAYPELIRRFLRGSMTAHAHRYAASTITRIIAGSTAVTNDGHVGATASVLGAIELQATDYRYRHRMADGATLELVAPRWLRGVLRSDLAKRAGVDMLSVSDAQLQEYLRDRGVSAQFVYNFDDFFAAGAGMGAAAPPVEWPANVRVLLYAAGTWVRVTSDIITLDAVYDSTLFRTNKYNALFTEEGLQVIKRCFDSRILTIPLCPDGATGAQVTVDCTTLDVA